MPKNLEGERVVRRRAGEIPPTPPEELDRLLAMQEAGDVDTSDISESTGRRRLVRDAAGDLPPRRSIIREAVHSEMGRRGLSNYALWKAAKAHAPTISETAIGEFLKGHRSLGIALVEALLSALALEVVPQDRDRPGTAHGRETPPTKSKVDGTIQFLREGSSEVGTPPIPIGAPHPAMFLIAETPIDPTITQWGGAADVACDVEQVTRDATAAGLAPVPQGCVRDLGEFRARIVLADGRKGAIYIRRSLGQYGEGPAAHHRLDFIGVSPLGR
jgi:hypothetical protein